MLAVSSARLSGTRKTCRFLSWLVLVGIGIAGISLASARSFRASYAKAAERATQAAALSSGRATSPTRLAFPLLQRATANPLGALVTLGQVPSTPTVNSPLSPSTVTTTNPVLSVTSTDSDNPPDPISYQFQVSTSNTFGTIACQSGWLPTTGSWTLPDGCVTNDLNAT